ncbi:MAG: undecaprenyl-phosphate glucose phosphotransferase [Hyphomicrobiaceae bacterium]
MTSRVQKVEVTQHAPASRFAIGNAGFAVLAFAFECAVVIAASLVCGAMYHLVAYGGAGEIENYLAVGGLAALVYTLPFAFRDEYDIDDFLEGRRASSRLFMVWNYTFLVLAVIGFLTKTTGVFSRGWLILFYFAGLLAVIAADAVIAVVLKKAISSGRIARRRLMLVGAEDEIERSLADMGGAESSVRIVAMGVLPGATAAASEPPLDMVIEDIVNRARSSHIDDVVVLVDWAQAPRIERVVSALRALPVGIHVGAASIIGRSADPQIARFGRTTALSLTCAPLGAAEALVKRAFDIVIASIALLLLSPLLAVIAIAVRRDSPGPIFFRQRRRGYNQAEFRIWKFRTMTTLEDGATVSQVTRNDGRVTRVGRFLRRFNLDELPQLFNVIVGDMSLVGPRPHAVAHDLHFEKLISEYPRRLNMRPGITGWAQVHGYRGATETDEQMSRRVEFDIYYIENWSLVLDLYIMALTVLSPRAYRNAY